MNTLGTTLRDRDDKNFRFKSGTRVRHFKYYSLSSDDKSNGEYEYEVCCHALETETGREMVIYQSIAHPEKVWARYSDSFYSKVDKIKYPNALAEYRLEEVLTDDSNQN